MDKTIPDNRSGSNLHNLLSLVAGLKDPREINYYLIRFYLKVMLILTTWTSINKASETITNNNKR